MALFTIDRNKCARDGICVSECPARIIEIKNEESFPEPIDGGEELCINCGHCVAVCPHDAFSLDGMTPGRCDPIRKDLIPGPEHIDHFLRSRRSIRSYRDKPLDRETLLSLIGTAVYAPSGHNLQPVHWLVIDDREDVKRLAGIVIEWMGFMIENQPDIAGPMHFDRVVAVWKTGVDRVLRDAPHLIVAHGPADLPAAQPACVIALTYLELAAYSRGLGACWAGYFNGAAQSYGPMQEALALPEGHQSFGAMMLGHAKFKYHRIPLRNEPQIEWR